MNITLRRKLLPDRTLGFLDIHNLPTLEQPWVDNKPFHSCVPAGLYDLVPHNSEKHPHTWALVNPTLHVVHEPSDIPAGAKDWRYACLLHPANYVHELQGCIAPGMTSSNGCVWSSRAAMQLIQDLLGVGSMGHTLMIVEN